jgi:uncharacterized protein YcfJ
LTVRGLAVTCRRRRHEAAAFWQPSSAFGVKGRRVRDAKHEEISMKQRLFAAAVMAASGLALAAAPVTAEAKHRVLICKSVKKSANKGTVIGAVAGGLLGNAVSGHGARTEGTVIGAGVGAVAGHQIAKKNAKKKCHYEYRK